MSNIEKLAQFIDEQDPKGEIFPYFCVALAMLAAAGWKPGGANTEQEVEV